MTSKKLLEMMMVVYDCLSAEEKKNADYYLKNIATGIVKDSFDNSAFVGVSLGCTVGEIIRVLKQDIYNSENKKNGKSNQAAVIKKVLKESQRDTIKTQWHSTYIIKGRQYVLCGYYGFAFNVPVAGVPVAEDKQTENGIVNIFNINYDNYDTELVLPDRTKLAAYIKTTKAQRKTMSKDERKSPIIFDFGGNLPMVNAECLLNIIDGLPDGKLLFCSEHPYSVMYCKGSDGEALLLPVKKRTENTNRTEI